MFLKGWQLTDLERLLYLLVWTLKFIETLLTFNSDLVAVMDVAHGYTKRNLEFCVEMQRLGVNVVSGNIATVHAAEHYLKLGINHLRVGVGSGSVCSTRIVAGVGYPQGSALYEINTLRKDYPNMRIISDGGHRTSGDIVKALAFGADFVMLGGMLAGTDESEGFIHMEQDIVVWHLKQHYLLVSKSSL